MSAFIGLCWQWHARKSWIGQNLDLARIGDEPGPLVIAEGTRMIKIAGMDPDTLCRGLPCQINRGVDEIAANAKPDEIGQQAKIRQLDVLAVVIALKFAKTGGLTIYLQQIIFRTRPGEDCCQCRVIHDPA